MDHISITQPLPPPWPDILAVRPLPAIPSHVGSMFLWGDARVHQVALRTAAHALAQGLHVTVVDTGMAFQVMPIVAMGRACRIVPEVFLRRVHLVRAFTCWQLTTLLCDRLQPLLTAHPWGS